MLERMLFLAGLALQLFGVYLTIIGARKVWRDVANPEDRFLAPAYAAGRWLRRKAEAASRRMFGWPPRQVVTGRMSATLPGLGLGAHGYGYPSGGLDSLSVDDAVRELDKRLARLARTLHQTIRAVEVDLNGKITAVTAEQHRINAAAAATAETERQRAVSGVRIEAYGFIFLTLGTLVQAAGSWIGID